MITNRQATVVIDLDAIAHNLQYARELAPASRIMAVVKADAYGHGAVEVARKLKQADALAVARAGEGVTLRDSGVGGDICVLGGVMNREELNLASVYELQVVVHTEEHADLLRSARARRKVWLKIDTGMGRLGLRPETVAQMLDNLPHQKLLGLMSHLANADDVDDPGTEQQLLQLQTLSQELRPGYEGTDVISLANSAGILNFPSAHQDWVRPGLMLYGASPLRDLAVRTELEPAMQFTAPVIAVRKMSAGESVGYGSTWSASEDCRVAVVAAGYGDGYPREIQPGTPVLVNGERRTIVGRVSMDMMTVSLAAHDSVAIGDRVTLWGAGLPIEEIAVSAGTIPYTLMTGISKRVRKVYRGEE